jgi:hypothetical protein
MGSPFPGMDPYLEGEMWQEVHERLLDYSAPPPPPRLSPGGGAWVEEVLKAAGRR